MAEFGHQLGLAFQLKDDALDYDSRAATLGKEPLADLREGKVTLPLLLTLKRATSSEVEQITGLLKSVAAIDPRTNPAPSPVGLQAVVHIVTRYHRGADPLRRADEHVARAGGAIAAFPDGPAKQALLSAAAFSVARDR